MSLTILDQGYNELASEQLEITSVDYESYTATVTAPEAAVFGVVTFYSEGTAVFDACNAVQQ